MKKVIFAAMALCAITAQAKEFKCPEKYESDSERRAELNQFINDMTEQHPEWTLNDVIARRMTLLKANNCDKTLSNIRNEEKAD